MIYKSSSFVLRHNDYYAGVNDGFLYIKALCPYSHFGCQEDIRGFATEEEKQKLIETLAKNGYKWNAETKELEKVLPRALKGEMYFHIDSNLQVIDCFEKDDSVDNRLYESNNYFLTEEEAEKYAAKFKEILKNRT